MKKIFFFALALGLTNFSYSKEAPNYFSYSLEDLLNVKVSVASRYVETINESPSNVTVFTSQEISQMGIKTLGKLLEHVPSFSVSNLGDRKALSVRGQRSYSHVLLLVDGIRMNEGLFGGFYLLSNDFSLRRVEKVEIIRGPGSAMFGANAYFGVIKITTKSKKKEFHIEAGSAKQINVSASLFHKIGKFELDLYSEVYQDNDYEYETYQDTTLSGNGSVSTAGAVPKAKDSKERLDTGLKMRFENYNLDLIYSVRKYLGGSNLDGNSYSKDQNKTEVYNFGLEFGHLLELGDEESLKNSFSFVEGYFSPFGYKGTTNGSDTFSGWDSTERRFNFNSIYKKEFSTTLRIVSGIEIHNVRLVEDLSYSNFDSSGTHQGEIIENGPQFPGPSITDSGLFLQIQKKFSELLNLTAGVRVDSNSVSGSSINPRLSIISNILTKTTAKLIYGEAFRSPTIGELYQNTTFVKGNPNLGPEKVKTYELTLIQNFLKSRIQGTYYINFSKDEIEGYVNGSVFNFRNNKKNRREGIELEMVNELPNNFSIKSSFSHNFKLEKTEAVVPDYLTMGSLIVNWNRSKWNFNINGIYKHKYKELKQDSLFLINTKIEYSIDKQVKVFTYFDNLFDDEFLNTTFVRTNHQTNRGRMLSVGLEFNY